jgi:hypothetical protein
MDLKWQFSCQPGVRLDDSTAVQSGFETVCKCEATQSMHRGQDLPWNVALYSVKQTRGFVVPAIAVPEEFTGQSDQHSTTQLLCNRRVVGLKTPALRKCVVLLTFGSRTSFLMYTSC